MILINLLPHREAARKRRKEAFQATMFASFLIGLAIAGAVYWWFQMMITIITTLTRRGHGAGMVWMVQSASREHASRPGSAPTHLWR